MDINGKRSNGKKYLQSDTIEIRFILSSAFTRNNAFVSLLKRLNSAMFFKSTRSSLKSFAAWSWNVLFRRGICSCTLLDNCKTLGG